MSKNCLSRSKVIPIIKDLVCGSERHSIGLNYKGQFVFLNHSNNLEVMAERVIKSFGGRPSGCGAFFLFLTNKIPIFWNSEEDAGYRFCDSSNETLQLLLAIARLKRFYRGVRDSAKVENTPLNKLFFEAGFIKAFLEGVFDSKDMEYIGKCVFDDGMFINCKVSRPLVWEILNGNTD